MVTSDLVDVAVHFTYQTENGLKTSLAPAMLVPACANCYAMCFGGFTTCGEWQRYFCNECGENHLLYDDSQHPITLCCACARQYASGTCSSNDEGASTNSLGIAAGSSTYRLMRAVWEHKAATKLKDGYWVKILQVDILPNHSFEDIGTWMILSLALASKFPRGIAVFDLDRQKCIVCAPGQVPSQANINSALSWLRWMGKATVGIALRSPRLACFAVHRDLRAARLQEIEVDLVNTAAGLSPIDF